LKLSLAITLETEKLSNPLENRKLVKKEKLKE